MVCRSVGARRRAPRGRSGREPGTRERVIGRTPFIAVYRVTRSRIEILRILHGAPQWPAGAGRGQLHE
ncbi:MAG TPA: type II toxin-antitoxin system RelE/ParE family toxin [Rhodopila sp.]